MKVVLIVLAFIGVALSEDFQCYSCKDAANQDYVPCGDNEPKLETCNALIPTCVAVRMVDSNDQTEVWKGCTIHAKKSIFEELSPFVNDVIEKAMEDVEVNGCLDFAIADVVKTGSTLCFCSTPECNGATGLHILGSLLVFSVVIQRFLV